MILGLIDIMNIIQITHYYSIFRGRRFYGVRTDMSIEQVNLACAYLQLVRYQLPSFLETVEDGLGEVETVPLLCSLYGCEPLINRQVNTTADCLIDLFDNWNEYAIKASKRAEISKLARPGAKLAILEEMILNAKSNVSHQPKPKQIEIIDRLTAIKSDSLVTLDWGLKTLGGEPYLGRIIKSNQPDPIL